MENVTLKIEGMSCQGCVKSVTNALQRAPGVANVAVTLQPGEARVEFDAGKTSVEALRKAIEDAGYDIG